MLSPSNPTELHQRCLNPSHLPPVLTHHRTHSRPPTKPNPINPKTPAVQTHQPYRPHLSKSHLTAASKPFSPNLSFEPAHQDPNQHKKNEKKKRKEQSSRRKKKRRLRLRRYLAPKSPSTLELLQQLLESILSHRHCRSLTSATLLFSPSRLSKKQYHLSYFAFCTNSKTGAKSNPHVLSPAF